MAGDSKKKLRRATILFWVLLLYIIAALVWWFISLQTQNNLIYELKKQQLVNSITNPAQYKIALAGLEKQQARSTAKNIGEGCTFLLLILIGAVFLYRSVRNQFRLQLQQQNFMMAVTHELKTPISVTRLSLETMQRHQLSEPQRQKLLHTIFQETLRLDGLINNILISAQLEGGAYKSTKESLNLSLLVTDIVKQFFSRYHDRKVVSTIEPDIEINGDPLLLKLLVSNLLENANKYSPKDTTITCKLHKDEHIKLQVIDKGIGIAAEEKQNVFKQFYRIGNEQTRNTKGTGLGLYISKKIVKDHNGTINITDNKPQGSIFTVTFFV